MADPDFSDLIPGEGAPTSNEIGFADLVGKQTDAPPQNDLFADLVPSPGLTGYLKETGLSVGRGAVKTIGSSFQGYGAQQPQLARERIAELEHVNDPLPSDATASEAAAYRVRRGVQHPSSDVVQERIAQQRPMAETPASQTGLYKFGEAVGDVLPASKGILNPVVEDIAGALGSVGANIATAAIPVVGPSLTVASTLGQGAGEAAERAVKAGASEAQIARAAGLGNIAGATEFADALLPKLGSTGKALGLIRKVGLRALEGVFLEGGQEGLQEYIQNLIEKGIYNPNKDLSENVAYSAFIGAVVGGGVSAGFGGGHGAPPNTGITPDDLANALNTMAPGTPPAGPAPTAPIAPPLPPNPTATTPLSPPLPPDSTDQRQRMVPPAPPSITLPPPLPPDSPVTPVQAAANRLNVARSAMDVVQALEPTDPERERRSVEFLNARSEYDQLVRQKRAEQDAVRQEQEQQVRTELKSIAPEANERTVVDTLANYKTITEPVVHDHLHQNNRGDEYAAVYDEAEDIATAFSAHASQLIQQAHDYSPSTSRSISEAPDQERSQVFGSSPPVQSSPRPQTTISTLPPDMRVIPSQDVTATAQGQVLPPARTVRIWDDGRQTIDIQSEHMAPALTWLDHIVPAVSPFGAWSDIVNIIHRAFKNRLKQVVPPGLQIHMVSSQEMLKFSKNDPNAEAFYIYSSSGRNRIAPVIVLRSDIVYNDPQRTSHIIMHEVTHAATVHAMDRTDAVGTSLRADIQVIMAEVQNQVGRLHIANVGASYAFTNPQEFVAELFANVELQRLLGNVKVSARQAQLLKLDGGRRVSMWTAMMQIIHRMLGMPYNSETLTMLEAAIRVANRAIDVQITVPHPVDLKSPAYLVGSKENREALHEESPNLSAVEAQPETEGPRAIISALFIKGGVPLKVRQGAAHADRMSWLYKYMGGLYNLTISNPNHTPLMAYREETQAMHLDEVRIHDMAVRIGKDWLSLGERGDSLANFIDDLGHMSYRSPVEIQNQVVRHPSSQEFGALATKHKLDKASLDLFARISQMISGVPGDPVKRGFLGLIEDSVIEHIQRTVLDPVAQLNRITAVRKQVQQLRTRPYFPFTNFGRHYVLVRDPAGKLVHFETVERNGFRSAERIQKKRIGELSRAWAQQYGVAPVLWKPGMHADQGHITYGLLPEHVGPMLGMPAPLLAHMTDIMSMTPEQINASQWLQMADTVGAQPMLNPRFQRKFYVPGYGFGVKGYSVDLRRSFARYFFHGAKFYSKSKHMDQLNAALEAARQMPGNKEGEIAGFMQRHFDDTVKDAKGDWGLAKGMIFLWALGYVPAAAAQNLSQVPVISHAFLWAKFGERKTLTSLIKAMTRLSSYYKYGTYQSQSNTNWEYKALEYAIRTGRISESQASEIAAMAHHSLLNGIGGSKVERGWTRFMQGSSAMFEAAEQWNRRITFRAALELAANNPKAKIVDQAVNLHQSEYQQLLAEGHSDAQARAILTAVYTVDQTQYVYARWDRPRFMRKPGASLVFVFKKYVQSTMFMLGQNPDVFWRYSLISMFLTGLSGVPFAEDLLSLIKGVAAFFGKDWDIERMARRHIIDLFDGTIDPDIALRGFARRGLGIPWLLDAMGSLVTGTPGRGLISRGAPIVGRDPETGEPVKQNFGQNVPFPVLDRSRAYGMGQLLPFDLGKMMTPVSDTKDTIAEQAQKASGAFFSVGFNMYKSIMDNDLAASDWKRWERAMPRVAGDASEAFRAFREGRERVKGGPAGGSTVISYDTRDTEQMMEIIATALGYNVLRKQAHWDNVMAKLELDKFYELNKKSYTAELYEAIAGQNEEEQNKVLAEIEKFNKRLPEWARGYAITSDVARKSVEGHFRAKELREQNIPAHRSAVPMAREIDRLFPESVIDIRRR